MNLGDVKIRVKRQFGDESAVQVQDADIVRWANDAQRTIVMNNEGLLEETSTANSVAGQQNYALPVNCFVLKSITYKQSDGQSYFHLSGYSIQQFDSSVDGWDGNALGSGLPGIYTVFAGQVRLFPIPEVSSVAGIKYYFCRRPVDMANDVDVVDLPEVYHSAVVDYCLQQAYELDEDWNSSQIKAAQVANAMHLNRNRDGWNNQETYQVITILPDDAW